MDSVRFGRALGFGARSAAKALATAVDAASAPNPAPVKRPAAAQASPVVQAAARTAARVVVETKAQTRQAVAQVHQVRQASAGAKRGGKRLGEAVWGPFVKVSGVLWLEMTGSFFAIFAVILGHSVWAHRAEIHLATLGTDAGFRVLATSALTLMFVYFAVSSFVRARRKGR